MKHQIQLINYPKDAISDFEHSKYVDQSSFVIMNQESGHDLWDAPHSPPDIAVVFIEKHIGGCLKRIAQITKIKMNMEIIAAVDLNKSDIGIQALQSGASDFMILPASASTFDFYINRALERIYLHRHICFNDSCYKSRFARSQQNYQQLFNEVPCFVFVQDGDYHITEANRKFEEYFGHHIGEYCFGICKNRDEPCRECPVQKTIKEGKNQASEMEIISSDGVKHIVLCWTAPIRDTQGRVTHALVMLTDITEARRLEDHLTSLGFMIGSISHGIKGLLTSLDGGLYLMEAGFNANNTKKIQEGFTLSREMTSRIKKLVLDILYYTKTRTLAWEHYSAKSFMEETMNMVAIKAEKHGIAVDHKFEILTGTDEFEIDKDSLQAAMLNILENAIEACIDDQTDSRNLPLGQVAKLHAIRFAARVDQEKVLFRIQDNGKGMDKATLKNIFTIFFSSKVKKSTGLGLFLAHKVISQHRGEIKVVSTENQGTRFIIKIPRSVPRTAKNPRGIPASRSSD